MKLSGVIPPMLTPATDDGMQVDCGRLQKLTQWLIESGVNGLFVGATAGEAAMLDRVQRQAAIATVVSEAQKRVPVIAGVGAPSTAQTLQYARDAEKAGADYVMALPPGVFPLSDDELIRHYATVADGIGIPTLLYNFPEITGGKRLTPKIAAALAQKSRVVGVKDSSGELANTRAYRQSCGDDFALLMGSDRLVYPHLALGGDGMLCIGVNLVPKTYVALYEAFRAGDRERAVALQDSVSPIADICLTGTFPAAVKACLSAQGIPAGPPFLPVAPATDAQAATALELLGRMQAASRDLQVA